MIYPICLINLTNRKGMQNIYPYILFRKKFVKTPLIFLWAS